MEKAAQNRKNVPGGRVSLYYFFAGMAIAYPAEGFIPHKIPQKKKVRNLPDFRPSFFRTRFENF